MIYTKHKINGLTILLANSAEFNSVTIEILVKAGSIYESHKTNGLSHFLEHMFFKGGKKYDTPSKVAIAVERFGGEFNAFTGDEYAGYYVKCAPEFLYNATDVLADMMIDARFPLEEMEREKGVVLQEIAMYEDQPQSLVMDKRREWYFGDTSYGWPTLGSKENVQSFTQENLFEHKNTLYTKDNMVIVVSGKIIDEKKILEQLDNLFGVLGEKKGQDAPVYTQTLPQEKEFSLDKNTQQNHLVVSAPGFTGTDERRFAASVLTTILAGNMSSRMFQNIREKEGLCYYIGGTHSASTFDGCFYFRAGMDKDRFEFALEKIYAECDNISQGNIIQTEFDNAIGYKVGSLQMGLESSDSIANFVGYQELLYGEIETLEQKIEKYQNLTIDEVRSLCSLLAKDKLYSYWLQ